LNKLVSITVRGGAQLRLSFAFTHTKIFQPINEKGIGLMSIRINALFANAEWLIYEPDVFAVKGCRLAGWLGAPLANADTMRPVDRFGAAASVPPMTG
jgi:hypothetical protein